MKLHENSSENYNWDKLTLSFDIQEQGKDVYSLTAIYVNGDLDSVLINTDKKQFIYKTYQAAINAHKNKKALIENAKSLIESKLSQYPKRLKKAWEMTFEEFTTNMPVIEGYEDNEKIKPYVPAFGHNYALYIGNFITPDVEYNDAKKIIYDIAKKKYNDRVYFPYHEAHRVAIEVALKKGKPIPANVLAEYPDLVKPNNKPENAPKNTEISPKIYQARKKAAELGLKREPDNKLYKARLKAAELALKRLSA